LCNEEAKKFIGRGDEQKERQATLEFDIGEEVRVAEVDLCGSFFGKVQAMQRYHTRTSPVVLLQLDLAVSESPVRLKF